MTAYYTRVQRKGLDSGFRRNDEKGRGYPGAMSGWAGAAGFTLVEVLVALVVAAIGMQLAFEMFLTHARLLDDGARSLMARLARPTAFLIPGPSCRQTQ